MLERIVSGGQTGVDRAALDVAQELGSPCGGWCPKGRKAKKARKGLWADRNPPPPWEFRREKRGSK
jgi:endonuclease YncB( thermonuclease family)